jgi:hypothetical protein
MAVQAEEEVIVLNLPDVQRVEGEVTLAGPVAATEMSRQSLTVVPPVPRSATTSFVAGGLIEADGFRTAVVSIAGFVQGEALVEGSVGAILLPEEDSILQVFREEAQMLLELEVAAGVKPAQPHFSQSESLTLGFPRYRIFYYNTTNRAVSVRLFAYLGN